MSTDDEGRNGSRTPLERGSHPLPRATWPEVLLPEELAILLGLGSREEALKLARCRVLPVVELGKRRWFLLRSVLARLKELEVPAQGDGDLMRRCSGRTFRRGRRP